uniref:G-protein coupled receptors family 1 profile domain-containing protein n=1 Tax=Amphilophus citrinellus TaxID=61819 RepID=A0A3Q0T941_AMPCI
MAPVDFQFMKFIKFISYKGQIALNFLILNATWFSWYLKVGVPLNALVVWALGFRSRRHLVFRVYVLNLALADLVLILRTPLMLGYLVHNNSWPFGDTFCRLVMFLRVLGLYAAAFLLCAVALERCLCLLRPVWARLRRPAWAVPLACGLIWLIATILSAPYLYFAILQEYNGTLQCKESGEFNKGLFLTETIVGFIPSLARKMMRLYHVLFFTMLLFLTCWVPYFVCRFLQALADPNSARYYAASYSKYISLYLVYIKSALNPVLYVFAARAWWLAPNGLVLVFQKLLIYWDFPAQPSLGSLGE